MIICIAMEELIQINKSEQSAAVANERGRVYIKTFGCQMNVYDSEKLAKLLESNYDAVPAAESADLILINTCSVREKPEQKLYSMLGELRELKLKNPQLLIGVGGCVAQQEGEKIAKRSNVVDFVFGTHNLSLVPSLINLRKQGAPQQVAVDYRDEWEDLPLGLPGNARVSSYISISRGCNKNCTYCIVPTTRGPEVSRSLSEIEREIRIQVHRGTREVVLLGQTVNSYGLDLTPRLRFTDLLNKVSQIEGLHRIRFMSPHPQEIRSDFYELIENNPKICHHIHMPLQSGSDRILKLMNRNYRKQRYLDIIQGLKDRTPDIAITTDIIVGFPGETEEDFQETMEVVRLVDFDNSYSFVFSPRPGTAAVDLPDHVELDVKMERLQRLQNLQVEITNRRLQSWVGKEVEVLLDGPSQAGDGCLQGRLSQNIVLNTNSSDPELCPGMLVKVKVLEAKRFTLKGEVLARL